MKYVLLASLLLSLVMIGSADTEMINGSCNLTSGNKRCGQQPMEFYNGVIRRNV